MNKKTTLNVCATLSLVACAATTGVVKMGPDTYSVSAQASPVSGGPQKARVMAIEEAGRYCSQMGRQILVTNTASERTSNMGAGSADIVFRCLEANDPGLHRPDYGKPADVQIEDRRAK